MIFAHIALGVLVLFVFLGLISADYTISNQRGKYCFEVLFISAFIYIGYEVIQWLTH